MLYLNMSQINVGKRSEGLGSVHVVVVLPLLYVHELQGLYEHTCDCMPTACDDGHEPVVFAYMKVNLFPLLYPPPLPLHVRDPYTHEA